MIKHNFVDQLILINCKLLIKMKQNKTKKCRIKSAESETII